MFTIAAFWCGFHFLVPGILIQTISSRQSQLPCCQRHNGTRKPGVCISGNVSFFLPTHSINCFNILTPLIAFCPPTASRRHIAQVSSSADCSATLPFPVGSVGRVFLLSLLRQLIRTLYFFIRPHHTPVKCVCQALFSFYYC